MSAPKHAPPSASAEAQRARRAAKRARDQLYHPELNLPNYKPRRKISFAAGVGTEEEVKPNSEGVVNSESVVEDETTMEALELEKEEKRRSEYYANTRVIQDERDRLDAQIREMNRIYCEERCKLDAKDDELHKEYMGLGS